MGDAVSEAKFTKGPWVWVDKLLQGRAKYAGPYDNGGFVSADGEMVCWFGDAEQYYPSDGEAPSDEDKHLIAAAPDMYEALELALDLFVYQDSACYEIGRAALAKARGEQ